MKRSVLLFCVLFTAIPVFAFTPTATSNASQNTGTVRGVQEPAISVVQINNVTHGVVAYMNFPDAAGAPLSTQIQVAHTTDFVNWSSPATLPLAATNGITYERSGDPVLMRGSGWPYEGWLFCFGTLWTNSAWTGRSTIGVWYSTNGGVTWSAPDALDAPPYGPGCEQAGTCTFDDKPAAAIVPSSSSIYVAWTRTTGPNHPTPNTTSVYMSMLIPTRGWASIGRIGEENLPGLPGPTPVVDPNTNKVYLFLMNRTNETIRVFSSGDGWFWSELAATISAPGISAQGVVVGSTTVRAIPFLAVNFDAVYGTIFVVYHRYQSGVVSVIYRRFNPFSLAWTQPQPLLPNGHTQWNPTVVQMNSGDFVLTYYDYNPSDPGYTLYASRVNLYGFTAETTRIHGAEFSDPAGYNLESGGFSRIGEYQGLALLNGILYAATIYVPQSTPRVGNAWVVRFTPGP
jgi:hypothetical protein